MLRIAVCDDEAAAARWIRDMAAACLPGSSIRVYAGGAGLLAEPDDFDVILLDVQMEPLDGVGTARRLRARGSHAEIIFITAVREAVFDAFDVSAFHYLVKPVQEERLREVLRRAAQTLEKRQAQSGRQIFVKTREKSYTLRPDDILYFANDRRRIVIRTRTQTVCCYGAMAEFEKQAGGGFFRSHRGFLVNMAYVAEYDRENIRLTNGETVYLAKERYQDFVKRYLRFLRDGGVSYA